MDKTLISREVLEAEALTNAMSSTPGYQWPSRSCITLIESLCEAMGLEVPDYKEWKDLEEGRSCVIAINKYSSLGLSLIHI